MHPNALLKFYGVSRQTDLARKLNRPISTVADWFQKGKLPRAVQLEMQITSRGRLKAERRP